jgi:Domain of unknown function (DUF4082)
LGLIILIIGLGQYLLIKDLSVEFAFLTISVLYEEVATMTLAPSQPVLVKPNQFLLDGSDIKINDETSSAVGGPRPNVGIKAGENRSSQIWLENQKPGNDDWHFGNRASGNEIACYLGRISINKGESVDLKVHSQGSQPFTLKIYRLGDYGGAGARLIQQVNDLPASQQIAPVVEGAPRIRLTRCNWTNTRTLQTDANWVSGLYLLKLTQNNTGKETAAILIVRDDEKVADVVFKSNSFTWLAYNNWNFDINSRYTIYNFRSSAPGRSMASSYQRPWSWATTDEEDDNPTTWEQPTIQWLESLGYEIKYVDDIDIHLQRTALMNRSKALIIPGHSEYWTLEQYQAIANMRDAGKHLVFMGANIAYWRVRLEDTNQPGTGIEGDRQQMICHKNNDLLTSTGVPGDWIDDPITPTELFRSNRVIVLSGGTAPESKLLGVQFIGNTGGPDHAQPLFMQNNHPLFDNTGFTVGSTIGNLVGFEWDHVNPGDGIVTSAGGALTVLARGTISTVDTTYASTFIQPGNVAANRSDMTIYQAPSGGLVFATGSLNAVFGLKEGRKLDGSPLTTANRESPGFKRMFYNLLNLMGCQSVVEVPAIVSPPPGQPQTLFGNQAPASTDFADSPPQDYELGIIFSSNVAGNINAIRYYKAINETGDHTGHIWNAFTRELLISVAFTNDAGSGWKEQTLSTAFPISASTNYVVSVNANTHYVFTQAAILNPIISGNLSVTESGRFNETIGQFPDNSFTLHYFRDIVFVAN